MALVAPRVVPVSAEPTSLLARYAACRGHLDLGPNPAAVAPYGRVAYVPSAAIVARVAALADMPVVFDEQLRYGEDVDLVWRMLDVGWTVRYEPAASVWHNEPTRWPAYLRRRWRYGTSAAPLGARHPDYVVHLRASPGVAAMLAAALAGRPVAAAGIAVVMIARHARRMRAVDVPAATAALMAGHAMLGATTRLARTVTMLAWPGLIALARGSRCRSVMVAAAIIVPSVVEWWQRRPINVGPFRWTLATLADDLAYGTGVVGACVRHGVMAPLRPRVWRRPDAAQPAQNRQATAQVPRVVRRQSVAGDRCC